MVMNFLTSKQVLEFLPLNTWTEVHLLSNDSKLPSHSQNVYLVTTKSKLEKRTKDMESISLLSSLFDKVTQFKLLEIVAVEIEGKWYRGKLIGFNEYLTDNTRIELIDYGSLYDTKLENLFVLPYYFMYEPLALPVTFKDDFIPKKTTFSIKPLLPESNLFNGAVLVQVNCNDTKLENGVNEKQILESKTDLNSANGQQIISVQNMTNGYDNSELRINSANDSKIISVHNNITNGHDNNESSLYLSSSSKKDSFFSKEKLNNVPFKNKDYCILTYFEDFTCLYVGKAIKSDNGSYDFADGIILTKTAKSTDKIIKNHPVVGDMVKVFSPHFGDLFRAKILKNKNGSYDVFYIDYGNIETVPSNIIYELADELKKPGIAVKIGLCDLKNHQVTNQIKTIFQEFCDDGKPFVIEFDENSKNCLENVKLKDIENGSYINSKYLMKCTSIQSELTPGQIDKNTSIIHNNTNRLSDLKNNDIVFLKHFEDMDNVYIVKDVHLLNNVLVKCNQDKTNICKKELNVGDIVKIVLETSQYRAQIKDVDSNEIYVQNIDFGYCEFVKANSVCELPDELIEIPGLAIKIGIKVPFVKKTRDLDHFITNIEKIPLYIEFDERNSSRYQEITLRRKDNSLNIFEEFLKLNKNQLICNEISNNCEQNDAIIKSNESLINDFQSIILRTGDYCIVSYFKDFKTIYLCKAIKDCEDDTYKMHNLPIILKTMDSEDRNAKTNLVIGDIVKVFSHSFQDFYRAKIINIDNKDFYVSYIDFGNTELVHLADIFELSDELKKETILPTPVSIEVPPNAEITDEIQKFFTKLIDDTVVLCIESKKQNIDGSENVILKELKSGSLVNTEVLKLLPSEKIPIKNCENSTLTLVEDVKCADIAKAHDLQNVKILKKTVDSSTADNIQLKNEEQKQSPVVIVDNKITQKTLKNREIVYLRYFHDSSSVFVSRGSNEDLKLFTDVTERTAMDESKKKKLDIEVGDIVKAIFENTMYRAKILKKVDKNHFYISFIDFGNEETVNTDDIFELPEELKKIPDLCIKIGIKGSPIVDKSHDIVSSYLEELEDQLLYIEYDEENPNGLREASLKKKSNNCDVFNEFYKILDNPIDTKEESIQKPQNTIENETVLINSPELEVIYNIELRTGDTVFCTHFEDFNHLYLCKGSKNNTIPDNYSVITNSKKTNDIIVKKNPKYKDIVRVKFEEKIFRAEVLDKCGEKYSVFLIDIGKNIDVLGCNIYELPNSLKNIPGLALKVGLKGTTGLKITTTVKDYFYNLWQNDPVPLFLRYDEGNFNYLNEVSLVKQSSGQDIVEDLVKMFSTSDNMSNKPKLATSNSQGTKSNGSSINNWQSGDHVEVVFGTNVDNIFVRKIKLYEEFKNVLNQLKGENSENCKPIASKSNDIVAVYSTKNNGGIYRAKVLQGCDNTSMVKCSLIDIGQIDMIPSKKVFSLPPYVSSNKIPTMVRKVSLAGLNRILNSNISSYLSSLKGKTYVMEYDKKSEQWNKQDVILKELRSSVSLNDEIQKLFSNEPSPRELISQQRRLERKIIIPETKESPLEKPSHPIKSGSSVFITHFENFNSIFIRDASYEFIENFNTFNKQMLKYYRYANNTTKEMLKVGDKVCVNSLLNVIMYCRARITNIIDNKYNVFYLDYGNTEIVNAEDIMDLPKELEKFPNFAIKVQLQNMPPLNTKNEIQVIENHLKKNFIIPNATLSIEFNEFNPKGLNDVVLRTEYYKKDIVEDINDLLNAPPLNIKITSTN
ncbi:uncharacterized protein LOC100166817 isoform X3 [Acyrthosiphon pisum]|uniref:Tudor domain-containing protein n=1 Tax=Acyrthosiphon pisum TaxID=7029 RepID=A0A8R2NW28_ACYPI|nr:uncharacterized protein LOC100166817 isoform X3 [Acyrthosiphon pisum]